jgi:hypothetical protein
MYSAGITPILITPPKYPSLSFGSRDGFAKPWEGGIFARKYSRWCCMTWREVLNERAARHERGGRGRFRRLVIAWGRKRSRGGMTWRGLLNEQAVSGNEVESVIGSVRIWGG